MKKITLIFACLLITSISFGQTIIAKTEDGKRVILNDDKTWKYENSEKQSESDCYLEKDFVEGKTNEKLRKHVMVDMACKKEDIKFISMTQGLGNGIYVLCVKGKLMKYKRVGTVFMRDGDNPFEN